MTGCFDIVGALEDTMESFFLSETAKYLYLLHSNATTLPDFYIFSTEGHLLPVLPVEEPSWQSSGSATVVQNLKHGNCRDLCRARSQEELLEVRKAPSCRRLISCLCQQLLCTCRTPMPQGCEVSMVPPKGHILPVSLLTGPSQQVSDLGSLDRGLSMKILAACVKHGEELLQVKILMFQAQQ